MLVKENFIKKFKQNPTWPKSEANETVALYAEKFQELFSSMAQTSGLNRDYLMIMDQAYVLIKDCDHEYLLAFSCKCCCFQCVMFTLIGTLNIPGLPSNG